MTSHHHDQPAKLPPPSLTPASMCGAGVAHSTRSRLCRLSLLERYCHLRQACSQLPGAQVQQGGAVAGQGGPGISGVSTTTALHHRIPSAPRTQHSLCASSIRRPHPHMRAMALQGFKSIGFSYSLTAGQRSPSFGRTSDSEQGRG